MGGGRSRAVGVGDRQIRIEYVSMEACQMNNARSACTANCEILQPRTVTVNFSANPIILMEC